MDDIDVELRKWGNSLGVVVPAEVVRKNRLRAGSRVRIRVEPAEVTWDEIRGMLAEALQGVDIEAEHRELDEGWRDD